jgi:general secretion pathway protein F
MPVFSYRASTFEGAITEGVIEAADEAAALEKLKSAGVIPLRISAGETGTGSRSISLFRRTSSKLDLLTFTTELSALLGAGLPLDRGLNILAEISENSGTKAVIQSILKSIREGSSFSDALQKHPGQFSGIYINMVRAGEAGGVLDIVLDKLNEFLETSKEIRESVISAMIYPAILMFTGGASIIILLTFILPKFSVIFDELGSNLPFSAKILLLFSDLIQSYWWVIVLAAAVVFIVFRTYIRTDEGGRFWDSAKLRMSGEIIRKLETARFSRTLGTLLKSGVPLLQALSNARDVMNNRIMAASVDKVLKGAREGKGIAVPLAETGNFPRLALSMIKVGEETGQLDVMLLKVAQTYEKALRTEIKRFLGLLEPAMILIMAVVIGFIVISMLAAVFSMTDLPF